MISTVRGAILVFLLVGLVVGCGGDPPRVTGADKEKIVDAALAISAQCGTGGEDVSAVEDAVTDLLDARDKFGDQQFTISDRLSDVTVQDIMDRQAGVMKRDNCAPKQRERLEG